MPLITLTSDLGVQHHALSGVKGRILSRIPNANLIDISHTLTAFHVQQAVYVFKHAYPHFPPNTFHFILSDLYADKRHQILYTYKNGQHIFCPDNGFITMLFDDTPVQLFKLNERIQQYNLYSVTDAFIAQVELLMHHDQSGLENIAVDQIMVKTPTYASYNQTMLEAQVLAIDPFGNVILNVTRKQFEEARRGRSFRILLMRDEEINVLSEAYNDVPEGEKLCLFNTADYLEVAINHGHAASLFGFSLSNEKQFFYNTVKLFFE
jgi:S-adenosyl-L-methionine hydrolase (adenosine-forming)